MGMTFVGGAGRDFGGMCVLCVWWVTTYSSCYPWVGNEGAGYQYSHHDSCSFFLYQTTPRPERDPEGEGGLGHKAFRHYLRGFLGSAFKAPIDDEPNKERHLDPRVT